MFPFVLRIVSILEKGRCNLIMQFLYCDFIHEIYSRLKYRMANKHSNKIILSFSASTIQYTELIRVADHLSHCNVRSICQSNYVLMFSRLMKIRCKGFHGSFKT
jgi:hypothetical protein